MYNKCPLEDDLSKKNKERYAEISQKQEPNMLKFDATKMDNTEGFSLDESHDGAKKATTKITQLSL